MRYYHTCPDCGANLDPGERCDCGVETSDAYKCPTHPMTGYVIRCDEHCPKWPVCRAEQQKAAQRALGTTIGKGGGTL